MTTLLLSIATILLSPVPAEASSANGPVHLYFNGDIIPAEQLEKGSVNYYFSTHYEQKLLPVSSNEFFTREKIQMERYFIGTAEGLEEVTSTNYKELVKKYLSDAPELHKRLGKKGFRFENVRYMIRYYNKFKT